MTITTTGRTGRRCISSVTTRMAIPRFPGSLAVVLVALLLVSFTFPAAAEITVLQTFNASDENGYSPYYGALAKGMTNEFYGIAAYGGVSDKGTVFEYDPSDVGNEFTVLHKFGTVANDGTNPHSCPIMVGSDLYGTAKVGGSSGHGTIYKIVDLEGMSGGPTYSVAYDFSGGTGGSNPIGAPVYDVMSSALYGTTQYGGNSNKGLIYKVADYDTVPVYTYLHLFNGGADDGRNPWGSLVVDGMNGVLYGTTRNGGDNDQGTVFKIGTGGTGFTLLHDFNDGSVSNDGTDPAAGLTIDTENSVLYGTTYSGGSGGNGVIFKITDIGGTPTYSILHHFAGGNDDGKNPMAPVLLNGSTLYGTATKGGDNGDLGGVVFKIGTDGSGYRNLHEFSESDGRNPEMGLALGAQDYLYGSTSYGGGTNNYGVLYKTLLNTAPVAGFGNALSFDGTEEYIEVDGTVGVSLGGTVEVGFTVTSWVRPAAFEGSAYTVFYKAGGMTGELDLCTKIDTDGKPAIGLHKVGEGTWSWCTASSAITAEEWTHLAWVKSGSDLKIYIDGTLDQTTSFAGDPAADTSAGQGANYIGKHPVDGNYFKGKMDEVQVWTTALTTEQIQAWMYRAPDSSHPSYVSNSNPAAYWSFDQVEYDFAAYITAKPMGTLQNMDDTNNQSASTVNEWSTDTATPLTGYLVGSDVNGTSNSGTDWKSGLTFSIVEQGTRGTVAIGTGTPPNTFTYTPSGDSTGSDSFTYKLNDGSDDSNTAMVSVTVTEVANYTPTANFGSALEFDGDNDYVDCGDIHTFSNAISIEAWIKPGAAAEGTWSAILFQPNLGGYGFKITDEGKVRFTTKINIDTGNDNDRWKHVYSDPLTEFDRWYHVAGTYDKDAGADNLRLYIDGALAGTESTGTYTDEIQPSTGGATTIGRYNEGAPQTFLGAMDEVRFWDTALAQEQIQSWMYRQVDQTHPSYGNMISYYFFDEGTGTTVTDPVNSNNGTLTNMAEEDWVTSTAALALSVEESTVLYGSLVGSDQDGTSATGTDWLGNISFSITSQPAKGTVNMGAENRFVYIPNTYVSGSDSFEYTVGDGTAEFGAQTVSITIDAAADAPVAGFGTALDFDGTNDYISFPEHESLQITGDLSVECWINPDTLTPNEDGRIVDLGSITSDSSSTYNSMFFLALQTDGTLELFHEYGGGTNDRTIISGHGLQAGVWSHVAVTRDVDTDTYKLYVDGVLKATETYTSDPTGGSVTRLTIGANFNSSNFTNPHLFYEGQLDEVRIYATTLTQEQVQAWMYREVEVTHPTVANLVGYWQFNETGGSTAFDSSVDGNHGTLTNMDAGTRAPSMSETVFGGALEFDGVDDRVKLAETALHGLDSFSVSFAFKTLDTRALHHFFSAAKQGDVDDANEFLVLLKNGSLKLFLQGDPHETSTIAMHDGNWHRLTVTRSGSTVRSYIDGVLADTWSGAPTGAVSVDANGLWLGGDQDSVGGGWSAAQQFHGILDDVQIWNTALDQATIQEWLDSEIDDTHPDYASLVAYYTFDEASGETVTDSAGGDHNGTLANMQAGTDWVESTVDSTWATDEDTAFSGHLVASDADGSSSDGTDWNLTFSIVSSGSKGTAAISSDNSFTYTPDANENGSDSFTYKVNDGSLDSDTRTVDVTISVVNDAPVVVGVDHVHTAYSFDGTGDYISVSGVPYLDTFTVEGWVKFDDLSKNMCVFGKAKNGFLWYEFSSNSVRMEFNYGPGQYAGTPQNGGASWTPTPGQWYHLVMVFDGSRLSLYVDGSLAAQTDDLAGKTPLNTEEDFMIGSWGDGRLMKGDIDDVRVWSTARTAEQIGDSMDQVLAGNETSLVGYWRADEASGAAVDSQTNGTAHNGTLHGATARVQSDVPMSTLAVTIDEDQSRMCELLVTDDDDTSPDRIITVLPGHGTLFQVNENETRGIEITATGTTVSNSSFLVWYEPAANYHGSDSFSFKGNDGSQDSAAAAAITLTVTPVNDAPSGVPTISGTVVEDQVLTAITSEIADYDDLGTFSYQWKRSGSDIDGATAGTYTLVEADVGATIEVTVSYTDGDGSAESVSSAPTEAVVSSNVPPTAGFGSALEFDGEDDYLECGSDTSLDAAHVTLEVWVYRSTSTTTSRIILNKELSYEMQIGGESGNGQDHFEFALGGNWSWTDGGFVPPGTWTHLSVTWDGAEAKTYINGELTNTHDLADGEIVPSVKGLRIGARGAPDAPASFFFGKIDEVRIWNAALTAEQIQAWMYREPDQTHPSIANLIAYYPFNEGSGGAAADTVNGNDGILTDMAEEDWVASTAGSMWTPAELTPLTGCLVGSDVDGTSDSGTDWQPGFTFSIVSQGSKGTVAVGTASPNAFIYTPGGSEYGEDSFTYKLNDGTDDSDTATVYVTIPDFSAPEFTNLLTNPHGETGNMSGWTYVINGGDGWAVYGGIVEGAKSFIGSFSWCRKGQEIDLVGKGFGAGYLDSAPPVLAEEFFVRRSSNDSAYLKVELRDANHDVITSYDTGTFIATSTIQHKITTFTGYGTGLRYIYFESGTDDGEHWGDNFAAYLDGAAVRFTDTAGVTVREANGTEVTEGTGSDTVRIRLDKQPAAAVTIDLLTGGEAVTAPSSLTFTADDWYLVQTVTVTAPEDGQHEGEHADAIYFEVSSTDGDYNGLALTSVDVVVNDGTASTPVAGFGTAVDFDGVNDYVSTADVATTSTANWSLTAWFNAASLTGTRMILSNGDTGANGYCLLLTNGYFRALLGGVAFIEGPAVETGTWYHAALTRDGLVTTLYLNGDPVATTDAVPVLPDGLLTIGANNAGTENFHGLIDEVQVWSTTLTAGQIQNWMYREVDGTHPAIGSLAAYYRFNLPIASAVNHAEGASSWWDTGWSYRTMVTIENNGSSLINYQQLVNVDTQGPISAGRMQADGSDIRFTTAKCSPLTYWIESGLNSAATRIWVKVPVLPDGDSTIFMYYGNAAAEAASSGFDTFLFFDDFEDGIFTDRWTQTVKDTYAYLEEIDGVLKLGSNDQGPSQPAYSGVKANGVNLGAGLVYEFDIAYLYSEGWQQYYINVAGTGVRDMDSTEGVREEGAADAVEIIHPWQTWGESDGIRLRDVTGGAETLLADNFDQNFAAHRLRLTYTTNQSTPGTTDCTVEYSTDNSATWNAYITSANQPYPEKTGSIYLFTTGVADRTGYATFDEIFVRRYAASPPAATVETSTDGLLVNMDPSTDLTGSTVAATWSITDETILYGSLVGSDSGGTGAATSDWDSAITFSIVSQPEKGTVSVGGGNRFIYVPGSSATGTDSFEYRLNNGTNDSNTETVTIAISGSDNVPVAGFGTALDFDGVNDYVDVGTIDGFNGAVSVEAWVNFDSFVGLGDKGWMRIIGFGQGADNDNIMLAIAGTSGQPGFEIYHDGARHGIRTSTVLNTGEWYHLAAVTDGTNGSIFINGVAQPLSHQIVADVFTSLDNGPISAECAGVPDVSRMSSYIGRSNWSGDAYTNGRMDEVRIWNTALTGDQIQAWMYREVDATHPAVQDLSGYWQFDEAGGSIAADTSQSGNPGTLANMDSGTRAPSLSEAVFGNALEFDGVNDYVEIPDAEELDLSTSFTLSAWIYRIGNSSAWERIISKSDNSNYDYWMQVNGSTDALQCGFIDTESTSRYIDCSTAIPLNTWTHVAMTYDGSTLNVYYNGQLEGSLTISADVRQTTRPVRLGRLREYYNFTGRLDEVRIWNTALDQITIQDWLDSEIDNTHPQHANLAAYYRFEEENGTTVSDSKGSHDGTIHNVGEAAAWVESTIAAAIATSEDNPVSGSLVGSDDDGTSDSGTDWLNTITFSIVSPGIKGTAAITSDNSFTYTPDLNENGSDSFTYNVNDGSQDSAERTVSVSISAVNDLPTGSVTISGTATEDETLTAENTLADAEGMGTISYQWKRGGTPIIGATAETYTLGDDDVGTTMEVTVSYTDGANTAESVTSDATGAVANVNDVPDGSVTISGTATEDEILTASNTLSDDDGLGSISYQWKRGGIPITGATSETFTLGDDDVGAVLTVTAGYTDSHGTPESVTSDPTGAVVNINDDPAGAVTVDGTAEEDKVLTVNTAALSDDDGLGSLVYQWQISVDGTNNWESITGATTSSFQPGDSQVNKYLRTMVTYTDGQGTGETVYSSATAAIQNINDTPSVETAIANRSTDEDVNIDVDLSAVFGDVDIAVAGDSLTVTVAANSNSSLFDSTNITDTTLSLALAQDKNGTADITVRATDTALAYTEDIFTVTVSPVNDTPVVAAQLNDVNLDEDASNTPVSLTGAFGDADIATNSDSLVFAVTGNTNPSLFDSVTIAGETLTIDLAHHQNGLADITVRATDTAGATVEQIFGITVEAVNDAPVVVVNTGTTTAEGGSVIITPSMLGEGDVDDSGTGCIYTLDTVVQHGSFTRNGTALEQGNTFTQDDIDNFSLVYRHDSGETAADEFTFTLADGGEDGVGTVTDTFVFTITPVNDVPTITVGSTLSYTGGDSASVIDGFITLGDTDHTALDGASVIISRNFQPGEDVLDVQAPDGITADFDGSTGILLLSNTSSPVSISDYQSALRSVTYFNKNADNPSVVPRTVTFTINDGALSASARSTIYVSDLAPPRIVGLNPVDDDDNGHLEKVVFTFSEPLKEGEEDISDWVLIDADGQTDLLDGLEDSAVFISGATVTITLENTGGTDGTPLYAYRDDGRDGRLKDAVSNRLADAIVASNHAPVADAGEDQEIEPTLVWLDGTGSTDEDNHLLSYKWTQTDGPITLGVTGATDHRISFPGRAVGTYDFTLQVEDGLGASSSDDVSVIILNRAPTANGGRDRSVVKDADSDLDVKLDGSASSDGNSYTNPDDYSWQSDIVLYTWKLLEGPVEVELIDFETVQPLGGPGSLVSSPIAVFDTSVLPGGRYTFRLTVTDQSDLTGAADVVITIFDPEANTAPTAEAGDDITVFTGTKVTLTGHESKDSDGDDLTYSWQFESGPSSVSLSDSTAVQPSFTPSLAGTYVFELTVSDSEDASLPDQVKVIVMEPEQEYPVAEIRVLGTVQSVWQSTVGEETVLEGYVLGVDDPSTVVFSWSQLQGLTVSIEDNTVRDLTVSPVEAGVYLFRLDVSKGDFTGDPAYVYITVIGETEPPVADAGDNLIDEEVGVVVTLDGSGSSDVDGDDLTYTWTQMDGPTVILYDSETVSPSFTPPVTETYQFQLVAFDGTYESLPDMVSVVANSEDSHVPVAVIMEKTVTKAVGQPIMISGLNSFDADNADSLSFLWV